MQIEIKLFASLAQYLPDDAVRNVASINVTEGATTASVLADHGVPPEHCHLVLVNGVYLGPGERKVQVLHDGDTLAIWPPVAGG